MAKVDSARAFLLFLLLKHAVGQLAPVNPIDAVKKLCMAYVLYEIGPCPPFFASTIDGCRFWNQHALDNTQLDIEGTTDWYKRNFINYTPLKLHYNLTAPTILSTNQEAKPVRLSTLMCPAVNFTYDCQLDSAITRASATATTKSASWSYGATSKHTALFGIGFLGTGGKSGPTVSYSFSYSGQDDTTSVTTQESTSTGTLKMTVPQNTDKCFELKSGMNKHTQRGQSQLQAVFTEHVGIYNNIRVKWIDDPPEINYRLRHIWDIVRTAKAANLPEAAGWELGENPRHVTYANTIEFDFFLGTEGRSSQASYNKNSTECVNNLPAGWDAWLPAGNATTGRRMLSAATPEMTGLTDQANSMIAKLPRFTTKLLTATATASAKLTEEVNMQDATNIRNDKVLTGSRKLLQIGSPHLPPVKCPRDVDVINGTVQAIRNPLCYGSGLKSIKIRERQAQEEQRTEAHECVLTVVMPNSTAYNLTGLRPAPYGTQGTHHWKLEVGARNMTCNFYPTSPQELDARDAAKKAQLAAASADGTATPAAGEASDFRSRLDQLVRTLCIFESDGADCATDLDGSTDWYRKYFAVYPPLKVAVGAEGISISPDTSFSSVASSWFCQYSPNANTVCEAKAADMSSTASTKSRTTRTDIRYSAGFKVQFTAGILDTGPVAEYEAENTVDWGYSFSDGKSDTTTVGSSTTATVSVPLTPDMKKCAKINVVTRKVTAKGSTRAWVCAAGFVGIHQDKPRFWKDLDWKTPGAKHSDRAISIAAVISFAQQNALNAAGPYDWYIDGEGRGCLANTVEFDFDQGVLSYVMPQLFDKDSPECAPGGAAAAAAQLQPPSTPESSESPLVVQVVPLEGQQNVEIPCMSFANCGMTG